MLESWISDICDGRDTQDYSRLDILEQRVILRFLITCFQRIEITQVRKCCMQLLSPCIWLHISPSSRDTFLDNKVAKALFTRAVQMVKKKVEDLDSSTSTLGNVQTVRDLYTVTHFGDEKHLELANKRALFILSRDFVNSILNHFVFVLEDGLDASTLDSIESLGSVSKEDVSYAHIMQRIMLCENYLEFIIDLLSQLHTRRVMKPIFGSKLILIRCRQSSLHGHVEGLLFKGLVEILNFYLRFYIHEELGTPLDYPTVTEMYYERIESFLKLCYTKFKDDDTLKDIYLESQYTLSEKNVLQERLKKCKTGTLVKICMEFGLLGAQNEESDSSLLVPSPVQLVPIRSKRKGAIKLFLVDAICTHLEKPVDSVTMLNESSLYNTEEVLWNSCHIPSDQYVRLSSLAIFKLNLQYLTLFDYLYRNFMLFRLESAYQIRSNIQEAVYHTHPKAILSSKVTHQSVDGASGSTVTVFEDSYRMAIEVESLTITRVHAANVLASMNSHVEVVIVIDTAKVKDFQIRKEWQKLKKHDVIFLVAVAPAMNIEASHPDTYETPEEVALSLGINLVRGAEIISMSDEEGHIISDLNPYEKRVPIGFKMTIKAHMDYNQYVEDMEKDPNMYLKMNLLIRRHARENNFKAVLGTLRSIINKPVEIPEWLHDLFLGFGDPQASQYSSLEEDYSINFLNTWKDLGHLWSTCKGFVCIAVEVENGLMGELPRIDADFESREISESECKILELENVLESGKDILEIVCATLGFDSFSNTETLSPGKQIVDFENKRFILYTDVDMLNSEPVNDRFRHPLRSDLLVKPKLLLVRPKFKEVVAPSVSDVKFTSSQVEAIRSGVSPGLTLVVGPPGTGKTDTVSQIISILFKNYTNERIVICTHSNFALNDIFTKLVLNGHVDEHHIVRLGSTELEIGEYGDFSKWGRVNFILQRRLDLLALVKEFIDACGIQGDYDFSIQMALQLFDAKLLPNIKKEAVAGFTSSLYPQFFAKEIEFPRSVRDLKLLWSFVKGSEYTKDVENNEENSVPEDEANPGTVTKEYDAVLCKNFLIRLYSCLKELLPFEVLRNNTERGKYLVEKFARMVAMTCTHAAIARQELEHVKYSTLVLEEAAQVLEIETFIPLAQNVKRVVLSGDHLQLPPVVQNKCMDVYGGLSQSLFSRMIRLGTPHVVLDKQGRSRPEIADLWTHRYKHAIGSIHSDYPDINPGFKHFCQFVHVNGTESAPIRHFYQNLQEAELVVSVYKYIRISQNAGKDAPSIAILTAYNGQKALVEDVVKKRCADGHVPFISTIDKFQGRQADYALISLVRTERPGHLRDARRILVALSRARLGLYIFGNWRIFKNCKELDGFSSKLDLYPKELELQCDAGSFSVSSAKEMDSVISQLRRL
ncbi:conserved hypothetical protein [Theileria equi strain WA]|uniref:Uncharacterized protein n=1 Tax=Theileria equi strain WA TaxID=1537102 RepID=L1LB35_THEEQ|nr:conserved hypothetical protein [Theileria equi strain WA]EKX72358.1 conserved hypothetical protein [Theileria equi strain WA]|eukprot:XP_004831810.1 conserved hypothetical protein [Theileria equi strain WA]